MSEELRAYAVYKCGCPLAVNTEWSNEHRTYYIGACPEHDQPIDGDSIVWAMREEVMDRPHG